MQKVVVQIVIFVGLFFMTWFSFRQVDWMKNFNIAQKTKSTEEKLGDFIWEALVRAEDEIKDRKIITPVDSLLTRICISNKIDRKKIKLHILNSSEVNAFALPNHHLVVFSGLINESINENELSGVISHELAHIELNHVMKKLVKEVGLSVLLSMTTGSGGEVVKEIVRLKWMIANCDDYGFSWEVVPEEPWHIRYTKGDDVPEAVKAWMAANPSEVCAPGQQSAPAPQLSPQAVSAPEPAPVVATAPVAVQANGPVLRGKANAASNPVLKLGSEGSAVKTLQQLLVKAGVQCATDGKFGPKTEQAVKNFQSKVGIEQTGVVNNKTWMKINP